MRIFWEPQIGTFVARSTNKCVLENISKNTEIKKTLLFVIYFYKLFLNVSIHKRTLHVIDSEIKQFKYICWYLCTFFQKRENTSPNNVLQVDVLI